jgi:hypothetical protein
MQAAVAWFSENEDWNAIRATSTDLQDTYDEWHRAAVKGVKAYTAQGFVIVKTPVSLDDLRKREAALGRKINSQDRAQLAIEIAARKNNRLN